MAKYGEGVCYAASNFTDIMIGTQYRVTFEIDGADWTSYMFQRLKEHKRNFPEAPKAAEMLQMLLDFVETERPA